MRCTICDRRGDLPGGPRDGWDLCDDCYRATGDALVTVPDVRERAYGVRS
jgi:hypothetical protein